MSKQNTLMISSALLLSFSFMIHYGYCDYVLSHNVIPDYRLFYGNFLLLLAGFYGLFQSIKKNKFTMIILPIVYLGTTGMMYQDVLHLEDTPYYPDNTNPDVWMLMTTLGWLLIGYIIPSTDRDKMTSILLMFVWLFSLFWINPKSRQLGMASNPSFVLFMAVWFAMSHFNK